MALISFAPRITTVSAGTTADIADGEPIRVYGFMLSTTTGAIIFTFANAAGTTLFTAKVEFEMAVMNIPFLADAGLRVTAPANGTAVIFHGHPGT